MLMILKIIVLRGIMQIIIDGEAMTVILWGITVLNNMSDCGIIDGISIIGMLLIGEQQ